MDGQFRLKARDMSREWRKRFSEAGFWEYVLEEEWDDDGSFDISSFKRFACSCAGDVIAEAAWDSYMEGFSDGVSSVSEVE